MFGTDRRRLPPVGDCKVNAFFHYQFTRGGGVSGSDGGGGMVVEVGWFTCLTSDQLEEPEISEEEICHMGTSGEGPGVWAPAWGEVRDINHTS